MEEVIFPVVIKKTFKVDTVTAVDVLESGCTVGRVTLYLHIRERGGERWIAKYETFRTFRHSGYASTRRRIFTSRSHLITEHVRDFRYNRFIANIWEYESKRWAHIEATQKIGG